MTVIIWIVRLLVLLLLIRLVMRLLFPPPADVRRQVPRAPAPERLGGALVRDPHCGTYIPKSSAVTTGSGASMLYFCSTECRDAFSGAPSFTH